MIPMRVMVCLIVFRPSLILRETNLVAKIQHLFNFAKYPAVLFRL